MEKEFLKITAIEKIYDGGSIDETVAIDRITCSLSRGEFAVLVGGNGAGKSTFLNLISGSVKPTQGAISLDKQSLVEMPEFLRSRFIARVKQNPNDGIVTSMTVAENLALAKFRGCRAGFQKGVKKDQRVEFSELLAPLGLGLEKRLNVQIGLLSGGQKQAIALVMAILAKPKLLLLDEHTAALDQKMSKKILEITEAIVRQSGLTTIMITHNINDAICYGDKLIILNNGKIVSEKNGKIKKALSVLEVLEKFN